MLGAAIVVATEFVAIGLARALVELALSPAQVGFLVTVFALASALLGPMLVAVTAHFRPGPVLAAALLPFAASSVLIPFPSFAMAVVLRVLQGATLPLFMSLAGAQLAMARGAGAGVALLYVGVTIGGTLAPPARAFAAERLGWKAPLAVLGAFALIAAAACLQLSGSKPTDDRKTTWRLLARAPMWMHLLLSALTFAAILPASAILRCCWDARGSIPTPSPPLFSASAPPVSRANDWRDDWPDGRWWRRIASCSLLSPCRRGCR